MPLLIFLLIIFKHIIFKHITQRDRFLRKPCLSPRPAAFLFLVPLLGILIASQISQAQSPASSTPVAAPDAPTMQALLDRIDRLEARVRQLEAAQHPVDPPETSGQTAASQPGSPQAASSQPASSQPTSSQPTSSQPTSTQTTSTQTTPSQSTSTADASQHGPALPPPVVQSQTNTPAMPPHEHEAEASEHSEYERMDLSKTLLRIRGFGDVDLHGDNYHPAGQRGDTTSFSLGELNLFVTSDISDRFHFLSEIVFEAGPDNTYGVIQGPGNEFGVDIERYLLTYSYNDYFNLSAGRYHTAIGYYNTAFHHSTWLQTTTGRPLLFEFEDSGGILPIHNVGIEAYGRIPSGSLGLHYVAEIGNGRESRSPLESEPVQNVTSDKNHKALNFEVFARPTRFPGLQTGFSIYRDLLVPADQPVGETILAAHAVYTSSAFEWLNEALVIRHTPLGGHTFATPGWYSQISHRWSQYTPYFRYQYINASSQEPIFPDIQLRAGPSAGLRYDANESVALKLQYDYTALRNEHATQGLEAQIGFTF